ncbi:MAG TPA: TonB family protein [Longimicrobiales bacterium]|nr:TonB family protein [Longimicrobiales bacterium]
MTEQRKTPRRTEVQLRRWDRTFRWSLLASVLFHILLVLFFREDRIIPDINVAAAGEDAGDPQAAAGGGMEVISYRLQTPTPEPEPEVAEPVPVVEPEPEPEPQPEEEPSREPAEPLGQQAGAGEGRGTDTGPGTETGTGRGDGGTAEEGLSRVTAPSPRGMILPPSDRPGRVKGMTVTVYVFVAPTGAVVSDSTRIAPSTGDSRFDRRLRDDAAQWKFRPGMRGGQPIAAWFPYTITF